MFTDLPGCLQCINADDTNADDTIVYASSLFTAELFAKLNSDLFCFRDWLLPNKLCLNVTKTEYVFLQLILNYIT